MAVLQRVDCVHNEALESYPKTIRTQLKLTLRTASLVSTSGSFGCYPNLLSARKGVTAGRTGNHSAPPIVSVFRGLNCIGLFRERLSEKMCTRQYRKVIWDMITTVFLSVAGDLSKLH